MLLIPNFRIPPGRSLFENYLLLDSYSNSYVFGGILFASVSILVAASLKCLKMGGILFLFWLDSKILDVSSNDLLVSA